MAREAFTEEELEGLSTLFRKEDEKAGGRTYESYQKIVQEMAALL
jgi:hypothetical protein